MANRFTDTEIWGKEWFRKLPPQYKCLWWYLFSKCNHAGIWDVDISLAEFQIGDMIGPKDSILENAFKGRIIPIQDGRKWFLPGFILHQYKCTIENLNPANKVHKSVIDILKKEGVYKDHASPLQGAKDKDKDKDKNKEQEKEKEGATEEKRIKPGNVIDALNRITGREFHKTETYYRHINARVKEGYILSDFELVIKRKVDQWKDDPEKREYLRPQTLFGTKFDSYLQEARIWEKDQEKKTKLLMCSTCYGTVEVPVDYTLIDFCPVCTNKKENEWHALQHIDAAMMDIEHRERETAGQEQKKKHSETESPESVREQINESLQQAGTAHA